MGGVNARAILELSTGQGFQDFTGHRRLACRVLVITQPLGGETGGRLGAVLSVL